MQSRGFFSFESIYTMNKFLSLWNGGGSSFKWGSWFVRFCSKHFRVVDVMLGLGTFLRRLFGGSNKFCKLLQRWKHHLCFARFMGCSVGLFTTWVWRCLVVYDGSFVGTKGERFFKFVISLLSFFGEVLFKFLFTYFIVRFGGISFNYLFFRLQLILCDYYFYAFSFCVQNLLEFCFSLRCEYLDFVLVFWVLLYYHVISKWKGLIFFS